MKRPARDQRECKGQFNLKELKVKNLFLFVLMTIFISDTFANRLDDAEAAYNSGDFVKAAKLDGAECKENQNMAACTNLARAYYIGEGVEQDYQKAVSLHELICLSGFGGANLDSCYKAAHSYNSGKLVKEDKKKAKHLSNYACKLGHKKACNIHLILVNAGIQ